MRTHAVVGLVVGVVLTVQVGILRSDSGKETETERIARLVTQLGDDSFEMREAASRELDAIGELALAALRKAAASSDDLEIRQRAERVIESIIAARVATRYKDRLTQIVNARNELAKAMGSGDNKVIALKHEMAQKQLSLAQVELIKVESDLRRMELEAKIYKTTSNEQGEVLDKLIEVYLEKALAKELEHLAMLEVQLEETRRVLDNEQHPKIRKLLQEIADKKKAIETRRKELYPLVKAELQKKGVGNSQDRSLQLSEQLQFNKEFRYLLEVEISRLEQECLQLSR